MLVNSGFQVALGFVVRRRSRLFQQAVRFCLTNEKSKHMRNSYVSRARNMAAQRLARGADVSRFDFFTPLVGEKSPDATVGFLAAQGSTLVAAGTETTATFLTGLTFYLLKNPEKLARMQAEVRARFGTSAEITEESTRGSPYLCAVVEEGLRIFNPAAFGLPRVSPGTHVQGHWVPEGVSSPLRLQFQHCNAPANSTWPLGRQSWPRRATLCRATHAGFTRRASSARSGGCHASTPTMIQSTTATARRPPSPSLSDHAPASASTCRTWRSASAWRSWPGTSAGIRWIQPRTSCAMPSCWGCGRDLRYASDTPSTRRMCKW